MDINCPKCATIVPAGARFCPGCGAPQAPATPSQSDNGYASLYPDERANASPTPPVAPTPPITPPPAQNPPQQQSGYTAAPPPPPPYQAAPGYQQPSYQQQPYQQAPYQPAPPVQTYPVETTPPARWPWLVGGAALIALSLAVFGFMRDGSTLKPIDDKTLAEQSSDGKAGSEAPKVVSPAETLYVVTEANVRNKPTTAGTQVVSKLTRGTKVTGDVVVGAKDQRWLKLAGKEEYVSLVNLAKDEPEVLASTSNTNATIANRCPVLTEAHADAPIKVTLQPGNKIKITGITPSGYAEFALPKGGVGYAEEEGIYCLSPATGTDRAVDGPSDGFSPPSADEPGSQGDGFVEER